MKLLVSSSVIGFKEKAEKVWGLEEYKYPKDKYKPTVFFGMYHIGDYYHFLRHRGKKSVFWAGYDLINLKKNLLPWYKMFRGIDNYVENRVEQKALEEFGILSFIRPSFLEEIPPVSFKPSKNPQVYLSMHPGREHEYGLGCIFEIAGKVPNCHFHIYGIDRIYAEKIIPQETGVKNFTIRTEIGGHNIHFHGRVPPEQFNEEIKEYQAGLRLNLFDGNSEIPMKSVLQGQYPITVIKYPHIDYAKTRMELIRLLVELEKKTKPNLKAREYWIKNINRYPWTQKKSS